jgi:hypothetical protein
MGTAMGASRSEGEASDIARGIKRLPASYKSLKPGMHCDGCNLYLQLPKAKNGTGAGSWFELERLETQFATAGAPLTTSSCYTT